MALSSKQSLSVLRKIANELRLRNSEPVSKTTAIRYLLNEYRRHQVTDKQVCKSEEELLSMAKTYLSYLQSVGKHQALLDKYHGRGERTVEETASIVGFRLPNRWKDPGNQKP